MGNVLPTQEFYKILSAIKKVKNQSNTCNIQRFGYNDIMFRDFTKCTPIHETNTNASAKILETCISDIRCQNSCYKKSEISSELVVRYSQHYKGQIFSTMGVSVHNNNRCFFHPWVGGHLGTQIVQGTWTNQEKQLHINCLEMEAVIRTLTRFLGALKGQNVLIRSDNSTVVQYINKQGGTRSILLCQKTLDLWHLAIQNQIQLKSAHIAGKSNVLADMLSRTKIRHTEWSLNTSVVHQIFQLLGFPQIDLFASAENKKTQIFCSWYPHPNALAVDALSIPWENMFAYAFPPICLIPKVLHHMSQYKCQIILVAPHWPRRHWYPDLLKMLIDFPIKLPNQENLLYQKKENINHPNPQIFNLIAWPLSTEF